MNNDPIQHLIRLLCRLPGVGEKSATRMVFSLLQGERTFAENLAVGLQDLVERVRFCSICCNLTESDPCTICADPQRDQGLVCVVEQVPDLLAIERTREFKGVYHVLHGALAPLEGITPDQLRVRELLQRLPATHAPIREIIVATNPTVEGESTALYLFKILSPSGVPVTRIASGIPMGGDLEYIDRNTLIHALQQRRPIT
ncbi:MAG: recombination protein RecR [Deltaproteobacteria bacterium]|nr:MAG: recombination protein RecR [Deltaproteobacteria bacterium]